MCLFWLDDLPNTFRRYFLIPVLLHASQMTFSDLQGRLDSTSAEWYICSFYALFFSGCEFLVNWS